MPEQTPEVSTLAAINAVVDLYYVYVELADYVRQTKHTRMHTDIDLFYNREGLKALLVKYHTIASADPIEVPEYQLPTLPQLLPVSPVSKMYGNDAVWQQIMDARADVKQYSDAVGAPGNTVPSEVNEVVGAVRQFIDHLALDEDKQTIVINESGVGILGAADRHYALRGERKKLVMQMLASYPVALSAKRCARLMNKPALVQSELIQQVSADVNDINKRFKKNLQIEHDLIINRNGYLLNGEELHIVC